MNSFPKISFYYILPVCMGFSMGMIIRDHNTIDINKKLSVSLAEYYSYLEEEPNEKLKAEFPNLSKLLKKIN